MTASFKVSTADASFFPGQAEKLGDVLLFSGASNQRILIGTDCNQMPLLQLQGTVANVGGSLNAAAMSTSLMQTGGLHLTAYDPTHCNALTVVAPQFLSGGGGGASGFSNSGCNLLLLGESNFGIGVLEPAYPLHVGRARSNVSIFASGNITAFSDLRVKKDLEPIPGALDKVCALTGYTYTRTDGDDPFIRDTGVVAQEVLAVLPEAVHEDPSTGMLSVAYGNMVGLLIEAIKELRAKI